MHAIHQVCHVLNQSLREGTTGLNVNEGCFDHERGIAHCRDDVRHIFNVAPLPCRILVDNPRRLATS